MNLEQMGYSNLRLAVRSLRIQGPWIVVEGHAAYSALNVKRFSGKDEACGDRRHHRRMKRVGESDLLEDFLA